MPSIDERAPVLMVLEREKSIIPVNPMAFHVTQTSRNRLNPTYQEALVIWPDGVARRVKSIDVVGLWGTSLRQKVLSALTGAYEIRTHFEEPSPIALNRFKEIVTEYLGYDRQQGDPYLPQESPPDQLSQQIAASNSFSEVFQVIKVPALEDCLDVL